MNETKTQKNDKRSNSEKCKIFREKEKQKKTNITAEMDREGIKNINLRIKVKNLQDKVTKLKKIILKKAKRTI